MNTLSFAYPHNDLAIAPLADAGVDAWKVTLLHGVLSGVGASVSGSGAWAKVHGDMSFTITSLEQSQTYQEMKSKYDIKGGVSGFFGWLGFGTNAETHKEEIHRALNELKEAQTVQGTAIIDLYVSGQYPNVQVAAAAYVLVLRITDSQGSSVKIASSGDPQSDTGAQDSDGSSLPTRENHSSITL
jgi:hypothetical protein